ncbi:MAG: acylhydrolase [Bacteroidales bacterium]|jgi:lysophospholipase L1-like esterase|nr:GDSL-type esterase/lipase family protein [Bacteroidota bacterium]NLN98729.1 acylhydrolase [Bacteroidales bacterium]
MKKKLLLIAVVIFSAATCFGQNFRALQKRDWAYLTRYADENAAITKTPKVVFMGDSITEFWVRQRPDFFASNNYLGRGIGGQTTSEMLVRFRQDVLEIHPKYVALMVGTNDVAENNGIISLENMLDNIISMCELAKANKIKVLLCSVTPCKQYLWRKEADPQTKIPAFNALMKEYADHTKGVTYVDYFSALTDGNNACKDEYTVDNCHLTSAGYEVLEGIIQKYIK